LTLKLTSVWALSTDHVAAVAVVARVRATKPARMRWIFGEFAIFMGYSFTDWLSLSRDETKIDT
jgi:hypothetical protein